MKKKKKQQIHRTEGKGKGKGPKAKHLGRVELHEQRKVRVPSAKIALLLSKAFQEPSHHIKRHKTHLPLLLSEYDIDV